MGMLQHPVQTVLRLLVLCYSCPGVSKPSPEHRWPRGTQAAGVPLLRGQLASLAKRADLLLVYFIQMLGF